MQWSWKKFEELSLDELYAIWAARSEVFVVEQKVIYCDADGADKKAWHLFSTDQSGKVLAYLRAFAPGQKYPEASFGRVLTLPEIRGKGIGKLLVAEGLKRLAKQFGAGPVKISAQAHLTKFYQDLGFKVAGAPYLDVNIPHIDMKKS